MLHGRRIEIAADPFEQRFALAAIVTEHPDLDELVREQVDIDLVQHGRGQSVLSNRNDRMERVRLSAKGAALTGC